MSTHPIPKVGDWVRIVALVPNRAGLPLVDCVGIVLGIEEERLSDYSIQHSIVYTVELLDGVGHRIPSIQIIHDECHCVQDQIEVILKPKQLKDEYLIHSPTQSVEERRNALEVREKIFQIVQRMIVHAARLQFYELTFAQSWPELPAFELRELPPEIGQMTSLKSLDLRYLEIKNYHLRLGNCKASQLLTHMEVHSTSCPLKSDG